MASMVDPRLVLSAASLLLVLLLPLPAADVECCKKGADYPVKVSGVDISPDSIAWGKPDTFTISANTGKGSC
ncbi:ML domain protein [Musa troglodytarum]|uniref:ML domain protein n=1 Tax=Musa troglodytarum TaxID=320322 RepID=A0A9E7JYV4_9LILI|nr:ML domain protein [Musa troglodytarum]